ncbi:MAG: tetratricopeptide repeat protein [Candidatus Eisenbacteria bacterium]
MSVGRSITERAAPYAAVYLLALLLQCFYILTIQEEPTFRNPVVDSAEYLAAAERFAGGEGLPPAPFRYGPLYPVFLGFLHLLAGGDRTVLQLLQALFTCLAVPLTAGIAAALFGRTAGLVAGIASALYWPFLYFGGELLIEPFFIPLLLAVCLLLLRGGGRPDARTTVAAGLLLGGAAIARPNVLLLLPVLVLFELGRKRAKHALLLAAGCAAAVAPVTAHNRFAGGDFAIVSTTAGINFFLGNNPAASGRDSTFPGLVQWTFDKAERLAEREAGRAMKPSEVSRFYLRKGLGFVTGRPGDAIALGGRKIAALLSSYEMPNVKDPNFSRARSPFLSLPVWVGFGVAAPLALVGLLRKRKRGGAAVILVIAAYTVSVLLFFVNARYRLPLVPFLLVFAAAGLVELVRAGRDLRRRAPLPAALLLLGFLLFNWNPLGEVADESQARFGEGWAAQKGGDGERAIEEYARVSEESAWFGPALNNRAVLLLARGDVEEATADLIRAVSIDSTYYDAWSNLGRVFYEAKRFDDAAHAFEKAARLWPGDAGYLTNLGLARKGAGDLTGAIAAFREALAADEAYDTARNHLAEILVVLHAEEQAIPHLDRLVRDDPANGAAWYYLGIARERLGDGAGSRAAYREVIRLAPGSPLAGRAREALGE